MTKFKVTLHRSSNEGDIRDIGKFNTLEEAAEASWDYAHENGYTRSSCEDHDSVVEALMLRQYCMFGYGPSDIEIEEVAS